MAIPYLKNRKIPRINAKPNEERLIHGSESDLIEEHCAGELMDAVEKKDVKSFRSAIEALVINCFEHEESKENERR